MIQMVPLASALPQRWRNGGGSTQELLTWPDAGDWLVRVSVARIGQDGPFSSFPGIERWFTVLHGEGVALRFAGAEVVVHADSAPLRFDGATAPDCALIDGATQDLNLMVRSDSGHGVMQRVTTAAASVSAASLRAVYTAEPVALHIDDRHALSLPADSLAWCETAATQRWHLTSDGGGVTLRAWWLEFTPHDALISATGWSQ